MVLQLIGILTALNIDYRTLSCFYFDCYWVTDTALCLLAYSPRQVSLASCWAAVGGDAKQSCSTVCLYYLFVGVWLSLFPRISSVNIEQNAGSKRCEFYKYLQIVIIDEISMVKADLLYQLNIRLQEIKQYEHIFGGISVLLFGDLMQLKPVLARWIFDQNPNIGCSARGKNRHLFSNYPSHFTPIS